MNEPNDRSAAIHPTLSYLEVVVDGAKAQVAAIEALIAQVKDMNIEAVILEPEILEALKAIGIFKVGELLERSEELTDILGEERAETLKQQLRDRGLL